jgi:hypothetical protein
MGSSCRGPRAVALALDAAPPTRPPDPVGGAALALRPRGGGARGPRPLGGRSHLSGGGVSRVWSKSRDGAEGVTVLMRSGAQARSPRGRRYASVCVRG